MNAGKTEKATGAHPCAKCDIREECSSLLEQNNVQATDSRNSDNRPSLRQVLEQYQQSFLKYQHLIENAPDAIFVADAETGFILEANSKGAELIGIPADQIVGMHQTSLHPPEEADKYEQIFREHIQNDAAHTTEDLYVQRKDGKRTPIQISASATQINGQKVVFGILRDMTEQKRLQQRLVKNKQKYKELYENAPTALYRTRISDGKMLSCNTATAKMIGFDSVEECLEAGFFATDSYVDKDRRQQLLDQLQKNGRVKDFGIEVNRKDSTTMWIAVTAELKPERDYMEGAIEDITLEKILSNAEKKILDLLMQGRSNKEIARELGRSVRTIEDHRAHIMTKLGADNIVELTQIALNRTNHQNKK